MKPSFAAFLALSLPFAACNSGGGEDGNGPADSSTTGNTGTAAAASGCLVETVEVDCDDDGIMNGRATLTYDAAGDLLVYEGDGAYKGLDQSSADGHVAGECYHDEGEG